MCRVTEAAKAQQVTSPGLWPAASARTPALRRQPAHAPVPPLPAAPPCGPPTRRRTAHMRCSKVQSPVTQCCGARQQGLAGMARSLWTVWRAWNRRSCAGRLPLAFAGCVQGPTGQLWVLELAGGGGTGQPCLCSREAGPLGGEPAPHAVSGATACAQPVVDCRLLAFASGHTAEGCKCAPPGPAGARLSRCLPAR